MRRSILRCPKRADNAFSTPTTLNSPTRAPALCDLTPASLYFFGRFVSFLTKPQKGGIYNQWAIKKPVPREGRVVLAQVVKLVNAGDCHSSGICSQVYKPYGFESRPGQSKAPMIIIVTGV